MITPLLQSKLMYQNSVVRAPRTTAGVRSHRRDKVNPFGRRASSANDMPRASWLVLKAIFGGHHNHLMRLPPSGLQSPSSPNFGDNQLTSVLFSSLCVQRGLSMGVSERRPRADSKEPRSHATSQSMVRSRTPRPDDLSDTLHSLMKGQRSAFDPRAGGAAVILTA